VSTVCAQILRFSRVRVRVRISLRIRVSLGRVYVRFGVTNSHQVFVRISAGIDY